MEILPAFLLAPHPQANFGCDSKKMGMYKWTPLNHISHKGGGFIFINGNTFGLSATTTPQHKLYFCSQTLAVIVKTMVMSKWAQVNHLK